MVTTDFWGPGVAFGEKIILPGAAIVPEHDITMELASGVGFPDTMSGNPRGLASAQDIDASSNIYDDARQKSRGKLDYSQNFPGGLKLRKLRDGLPIKQHLGFASHNE